MFNIDLTNTQTDVQAFATLGQGSPSDAIIILLLVGFGCAIFGGAVALAAWRIWQVGQEATRDREVVPARLRGFDILPPK